MSTIMKPVIRTNLIISIYFIRNTEIKKYGIAREAFDFLNIIISFDHIGKRYEIRLFLGNF